MNREESLGEEMEIAWALFVFAIAAATAIATVIRAIRSQDRELAILDGRDLARGGSDTPK
jgi:hypothetical protein